jgi:Uncharacterized protein conserved in bacteria
MKRLFDTLTSRSAILTLAGIVLITATTGTVVAQDQPMEPIVWDKRRLDQLDRNVRRIERALFQRNAAGQPILVEPDPEVLAMQGRVLLLEQRLNDLESGNRQVNGELERLGGELADSRRINGQLNERLRASETRMQGLERSLAEAAERAALNAPIVANSPTGSATEDLAAASRLAASDTARGERALLTVIETWPDAPEAREAYVRLGDMRASMDDQVGAVQAFAAALNGWPRTPWAPEAVLKLAAALDASDRSAQACTALGDFNRRYGEAAGETLRRRAVQLAARAECAA